MKLRSKICVLFAVILFCINLIACDGGKQTFEDDVNDGTTYLSLLAQTLVEFFQNSLNSCEDFQNTVAGLSSDLQDCRKAPDGIFQLTQTDAPVCLDGSPLKAMVKFQLEQNNCADENNILINGVTNFVLNFSGEGNIVNLVSDGVTINGNVFEFSDFILKLNFVNTSLNCSGHIRVNGEECRISSNCQTCRF